MNHAVRPRSSGSRIARVVVVLIAVFLVVAAMSFEGWILKAGKPLPFPEYARVELLESRTCWFEDTQQNGTLSKGTYATVLGHRMAEPRTASVLMDVKADGKPICWLKIPERDHIPQYFRVISE